MEAHRLTETIAGARATTLTITQDPATTFGLLWRKSPKGLLAVGLLQFNAVVDDQGSAEGRQRWCHINVLVCGVGALPRIWHPAQRQKKLDMIKIKNVKIIKYLLEIAIQYTAISLKINNAF